MRAGSNRSKPAATAVWVVKRFPARVTASATSKGSPCLFHETAGALQHGEGRMPFVEMTDFRLNAKRSKQPPSANPEQHSCFRRNSGPASVQLAGNPSMRGKIRRVIAVQQVKLHPADLDLPGAQPDRITGQSDLQPQPLPVRLCAKA